MTNTRNNEALHTQLEKVFAAENKEIRALHDSPFNGERWKAASNKLHSLVAKQREIERRLGEKNEHYPKK